MTTAAGKVKETEHKPSACPICNTTPYSKRISCTMPRPSPVEPTPGDRDTPRSDWGSGQTSGKARAVVEHRDGRGRALPRTADHDPRTRPFPRIVEEVAHHLAEVVGIDPDDHVDRQLVPPFEGLAARHVQHQAEQAIDRRRGMREGSRGGRGAGSSRTRQLAVDMAADELKLAVDRCRQLLLAAASEATGFAGENGERRLEPVGQRARPVAGPADELLLPVEEPVEVIDNRLHLARKPPASRG